MEHLDDNGNSTALMVAMVKDIFNLCMKEKIEFPYADPTDLLKELEHVYPKFNRHAVNHDQVQKAFENMRELYNAAMRNSN